MNNLRHPLEFDHINRTALQSIGIVLQRYLPAGKYIGSEYKTLNPTRHDNNIGSFSVNVKTGAWADFATNDAGGDCISLIAYINGCQQYEAAQMLADFLSVNNRLSVENTSHKDANELCQILSTVDEVKHPPTFIHPTLGAASKISRYCHENGEIAFYMCRFDTPNGKTYLPLTQWKDRDQNYLWKWKGCLQPYPLYNLHLLKQFPQAIVVICEGEKAADAASVLLPTPKYVVTTLAHGANAIKKSNLKPMHGRNLILWPDHDQVGQQAMSTLINLLGGKL